MRERYICGYSRNNSRNDFALNLKDSAKEILFGFFIAFVPFPIIFALNLEQFGIPPAFCEQFRVRSLLRDTFVFDKNYSVAKAR